MRRHLVVLDAAHDPRSHASTVLPAVARADADEVDDHFRDKCGVFGVYGHPESANITYLGLHALQHRGQESAGIVTSDGEQLFAHRAMGLVHDAFSQEHLAKLRARPTCFQCLCEVYTLR